MVIYQVTRTAVAQCSPEVLQASQAVVFNRTFEHSFSLFTWNVKERDDDGFRRQNRAHRFSDRDERLLQQSVHGFLCRLRPRTHPARVRQENSLSPSRTL